MDPVAVPTFPDGLRLSEWIESRGMTRSTAYSLLRLAGIEPEVRQVEGTRKHASFLTALQLPVMDAMVHHLSNGLSPAEVAAMVQAGTVLPDVAQESKPPAEVSDVSGEQSPDGQEAVHPLSLIERLEAVQLAIETGAPLSTADVSVLLGARLGGEAVTRGRVTARHRGHNVWTLEPSQDG